MSEPTGASGSDGQQQDTMAIEPHKMMQSIAAVQLYHAQREVANYLELAYLRLADHPDVARQVRMTAHAARSQHLLASGLMKKFTVTAGHIIKTMIPMILDAVELQDRDIVTEAFAQIIENAESMKKESEDTRSSYMTLQTSIQDNMATVDEKNKYVVDEGKRLEANLEAEKKQAKADKLAAEQLDEERRNMEAELEILKDNRDRWMDQAECAGKQIDRDGGTFLDGSITPKGFLGGPIAGVLTAGVNIISGLFGSNKKEKKFDKMMNAYQQSQNELHSMMREKRSVVDRRNKQRQEALKRLADIKTLCFQKADLGDVESLREASVHLGDVDKQLTRIIMFWENMAATLKYLKEDVRSGEVYLKKIEKPAYAERFKKSIKRAEDDWKFFGRICSTYVADSDKEIHNLYNFLSAPVDGMSAARREERQKQLMQGIENDIETAYPEVNVPQQSD